MTRKYMPGDIVDLKIERIVPRGLGIGFAEGLTVLVPLSAPGDRLKVRLAEVKKKLAFGEIETVVTPGPERIEPPCPYFGECGGCDFQQLSYKAQLDAKEGIIRDCLRRIGKIEYEGPFAAVGSPAEFRYRSRAKWHIDREPAAIGYYRRDSHDVIDVAVCPISTERLESTLQQMSADLDPTLIWEDRSEIVAAVSEDTVSLLSDERSEPAELVFEYGGLKYRYSAATFFQANKFLIPALIEAATSGLSGRSALDLYSGVGLFTLPLARQFERVTGVEESAIAMEFARRNIADNGFTNAKAVAQGVGSFLAGYNGETPDAVILDPPRAGTEKRTLPALAKMKPKAISYVSCEPSILARDLPLLLDAGYAIEKITAIDLFPQTHHVETVVRLLLR